MRQCVIVVCLALAVGWLVRYGLVMYYTFVDLDPWGLERYLSSQGVENARVYSRWGLIFSRCHDPSGVIGRFPVFTSIEGRCDEFDVLNISNCVDLLVLDVGPSGVLKHLEALKHLAALKGKPVFQVSGAVDSPILDWDLLKTMREKRWHIALQPTTNSLHDVCSCMSPESYIELALRAEVFAFATDDEIAMLRSQPFASINSWRAECFWEMIEEGDFFDSRKGYLKVSELRETSSSRSVEGSTVPHLARP